jgi:Fur family ferric uptake transcriptional regulator
MHLTEQREEICEVILGCPGHICAEHILEAVASRRPDLKVNKTTVYRALDLLQELNLVTEHKVGDGPALYEAASRGHHAHLICTRCGHSEDMDPRLAESLRIGLRAKHAFRLELESHPLFGLCANCQG